MLFNVDKRKIMHIGYNNGKAKYEMNGKYLEEVIEERDLGVIMQSDCMLFLDNKHLVVIGGVTAAVLAGVYVFWGPSESCGRKRNRKGELQKLSDTEGIAMMGLTIYRIGRIGPHRTA